MCYISLLRLTIAKTLTPDVLPPGGDKLGRGYCRDCNNNNNGNSNNNNCVADFRNS